MIRLSQTFASSIVFALLCDLGRHGGVSAGTYEKWSVLGIFVQYGPFPQHFGQVLVQIILYFIIIVRVNFIIAYPMVFIKL